VVVAQSDNDCPSLVGQMVYIQGERSAHLSFIAPEDSCDTPRLVKMMEYFAEQAGEKGAFNILAEVEDSHPALEAIRRAGFSIYSWQHIWHLPDASKVPAVKSDLWQPTSYIDETAIRNLYQSLVPPLIQAAEPFLSHTPTGLVYRQDGEILAFVEAISGLRGIYLLPVIHPEVKDVGALIRDLLHVLPGMGRPLYMAVRSYQAWLEHSLVELLATASPRQALLVKHMTLQQRVSVVAPSRLNVLERRRTEPSSSIVQNMASSGESKTVS